MAMFCGRSSPRSNYRVGHVQGDDCYKTDHCERSEGVDRAVGRKAAVAQNSNERRLWAGSNAARGATRRLALPRSEGPVRALSDVRTDRSEYSCRANGRPEPAVRLCHQRRGAASPNRPSVAPRSIVQSPKVGSADKVDGPGYSSEPQTMELTHASSR